MAKKWIVAALVAVGVCLPAASASAGPRPTPNGYCGALNMLQDPTMMTVPMSQDAAQGNAGMYLAVANSSC